MVSNIYRNMPFNFSRKSHKIVIVSDATTAHQRIRMGSIQEEGVNVGGKRNHAKGVTKRLIAM